VGQVETHLGLLRQRRFIYQPRVRRLGDVPWVDCESQMSTLKELKSSP
jgi:hypothetical protein